MEKYVIRYKGNGTALRKCDTKAEALEYITKYIAECNDYLCEAEGDVILYPFDFDVTKEEIQNPVDCICSFEDACLYLGLAKADIDFPTDATDTVYTKYAKAVYKIIICAKAWNLMDGFTPDFSNTKQMKYSPQFIYKPQYRSFVTLFNTANTRITVDNIGGVYFQDQLTAESFARTFHDLFKELLEYYNKIFRV